MVPPKLDLKEFHLNFSGRLHRFDPAAMGKVTSLRKELSQGIVGYSPVSWVLTR